MSLTNSRLTDFSTDPDYAPAGANLRVQRAQEFAGDGFLIVDKPLGVTSHDIVGTVRRACGTRKVGHAGTLDPAASGVLVVGVGRMTRALTYFVGHDKRYVSRVVIGIGTESEDAQGDVTAVPGIEQTITAARIDAAMETLTGDIMQVPSAVSAKRINGVRAHDLVRRGEAVELAAVAVNVAIFQRISEPRLEMIPASIGVSLADAAGDVVVPCLVFDIDVECSSGVYVRALVRDLARQLGSEGHVRFLRRLRSGELTVNEAVTIEQVAADPVGSIVCGGDLARRLWWHVEVESDEEVEAIVNGRACCVRLISAPTGGGNSDLDPNIFALVRGDKLVAMGVRDGDVIKPKVVFEQRNN